MVDCGIYPYADVWTLVDTVFSERATYDVQTTRKEAREDGKKEGKIEGFINAVKHMGGTVETAVQQLVLLYGLEEADAAEKVKLYW